MKFITTLFMCLFFSAIISIEAWNSEEEDDDLSDEALDNREDAEVERFRYKPSQRLRELGNDLPEGEREFVKDGKVKETMTELYGNSMNAGPAKDGLAKLNHEWELFVQGPEASRVIGTFGNNFHKVFTSPEVADLINALFTTAHALLARAGGQTTNPEFGRMMSMAFVLLTSPETPEIVNKAGGLIITASNKPMAALFVRRVFDELRTLLTDKAFNPKLKKNFASIASLMKNMHDTVAAENTLKRVGR